MVAEDQQLSGDRDDQLSGDRNGSQDLHRELDGLDRLEVDLPTRPSRAHQLWSSAWPKVAAILIVLGIWELVVLSGWKPSYVFPGPVTAFKAMWDSRSELLPGAGVTLSRAVEYYLLSLVVGTLLSFVITSNRLIRTAVNPLISGLQTMPNVAWVPFAIIVFGISSSAPIMFVALLGTVPAIIVGTVSAIDAIPPVLLRAGKVLGANGINRFRHVVLPAALPGYVAGMKQGWAFLWRSLMAGELIAQVAGKQSLGRLLSSYQDNSSYAEVEATMLIILAIGLILDAVVFANLERLVLTRQGLTSAHS